ncbi:hypothetical protein ACIGHF_11650 [Stenotrophomonas sp. NPDC077464]|uniref:hypothetical protein n=1 Tax=unclassified Stenotrophomonas TaxID=196198 RepID=UPI0037D0869A
MIEKLGVVSPFNAGSLDTGQQSLMQRLQAAVDDPGINPPEPGHDVKPIPPDIAEVTREMARKWWCHEFMQAMIFGDEEKLGPKPEEH